MPEAARRPGARVTNAAQLYIYTWVNENIAKCKVDRHYIHGLDVKSFRQLCARVNKFRKSKVGNVVGNQF